MQSKEEEEEEEEEKTEEEAAEEECMSHNKRYTDLCGRQFRDARCAPETDKRYNRHVAGLIAAESGSVVCHITAIYGCYRYGQKQRSGMPLYSATWN